MKDLNEKIQELSKIILQTEEFKNYEKAAREFKENAKSEKLFLDFEKAQQKLAILQQGDFPEKDKQKEKVEKLIIEVKKDKRITNWLQKRRELEILTGEIAKVISKNINFPLTLPSRCGSCSC